MCLLLGYHYNFGATCVKTRSEIGATCVKTRSEIGAKMFVIPLITEYNNPSEGQIYEKNIL